MWIKRLWADVMWLVIVVGALATASFVSHLPDKDFEQNQVVRSPTGVMETVPVQAGQ